MTREEFEKALDERRLWITEYERMGRKNYLVRRNGKTLTWKRKPERWTIPIKWKFGSTAGITESTELAMWFVIQPGPSELVGAELVK